MTQPDDTFQSDLEEPPPSADVISTQPADRKHWYRRIPVDAAALVAIAALIASLAVTYAQYRQTQDERDHNLRVELRTHIERASELQLQTAQHRATCEERPSADCYSISLVLRDEQVVTARQAAEVADAISEDVSSAEYRAVAFALSSAQETDLAMEFLDHAIETAVTPQDVVNARILRANVFRIEQDFASAREEYEISTDAVEDHDFDFESDGDMLLFTIESNWFDTEVAAAECDDAAEHGADALEYLNALPPELLLVDPVQLEAVVETELERCRTGD